MSGTQPSCSAGSFSRGAVSCNIAAGSSPTAQVAGSIIVTASNPTVLLNDAAFIAGWPPAIANMSGNGVTPNMVVVVLSAVRRLDSGGRRLAGSLNVAYTITIPHTADAGGVNGMSLADRIKGAIVGTSPAQLTSKLTKALTDQGHGALANGVTVNTINEPTATNNIYETTDAFGQSRIITAVRAAVLAAVAALGMRS